MCCSLLNAHTHICVCMCVHDVYMQQYFQTLLYTFVFVYSLKCICMYAHVSVCVCVGSSCGGLRRFTNFMYACMHAMFVVVHSWRKRHYAPRSSHSVHTLTHDCVDIYVVCLSLCLCHISQRQWPKKYSRAQYILARG
jgi:hypothetical protein